MADAATITLKAVLLPEEIQTTLKDLTFSFTPADANDKWYYKLVNVRHNASSDLIEGNFLSKSTGVDTASTNATVTTSDKVKFLFIKNTATTDGSTTSNESIYLCFDGGTAAYNLKGINVIGPGEMIILKPQLTTVADLHLRSCTVDTNGKVTAQGTAEVTVQVAAILDDVSV